MHSVSSASGDVARRRRRRRWRAAPRSPATAARRGRRARPRPAGRTAPPTAPSRRRRRAGRRRARRRRAATPAAACGRRRARRWRCGRGRRRPARSAVPPTARRACARAARPAGATSPAQAAATSRDQRGVLLPGRCRPRTARRTGRCRPARRRARTDPPQREPVAALAQRHGVVDRVAHRLGLPLRAQRAEVGRAVGRDVAHDRQPRERLDGELEPHRALGELRAPVVARLVRGDQPQLADLRLEGVRARDRVDPLGQPDHLAHPAAGLAGDEVLPHPGAQVAAGADVERAALGVAEDVDARPGGQRRRRGAACGAAPR